MNVVRVPVWWGDFYPLSALDTKTVAITSPTSASGAVGAPFSYVVTATNSPTNFTASPLPAGLTFNATTGVSFGHSHHGRHHVGGLAGDRGGRHGHGYFVDHRGHAGVGCPGGDQRGQRFGEQHQPVGQLHDHGDEYANLLCGHESSRRSVPEHDDGSDQRNPLLERAGSLRNHPLPEETATGSSSTNLSLTVMGTVSPGAAPVPRADAFNVLDSLVQLASERGIYTVIDMHGVFGSQSTSDDTGQANLNQYWTSTADQTNTQAMWSAIAAHYRGNAWVAGYDLLNEPTGTTQQSGRHQRAHQSLHDRARRRPPTT